VKTHNEAKQERPEISSIHNTDAEHNDYKFVESNARHYTLAIPTSIYLPGRRPQVLLANEEVFP